MFDNPIVMLSFRPLSGKTLIRLLMMLFILGSSPLGFMGETISISGESPWTLISYADDSSDTGDGFPSELPNIPSKPLKSEDDAFLQKMLNPPPAKPNKNSFLQKIPGVNKILPKPKQQPIPESKIINVGPRETPASPLPLMRLPTAIVPDAALTGNPQKPQIIPQGFYLVQIQQNPPGHWMLVLFQRDRLIVQLPLEDKGVLPEEQDGPVTEFAPKRDKSKDAGKVKKPAAPFSNVRAVLSDNGQSLVIMVKQGGRILETSPIRTQIDPRRELGY